jgi:two-component system nitrogen regulation response regulator NtrX
MSQDILIVDDEADIREQISGILSDEGYITRVAASGIEALESIKVRRPSLVILDVWLGDSDRDGLKILDIVKRDHPYVPVVMISGHGTIETAVAAIKKGAYDFIEKPFQAERLLLIIERSIESIRLRRENAELKLKTGTTELVGMAPAIQQLRQSIERVAPVNSRIFISGPTGSGKEMVARKIHAASKRVEGPFIALNCAILQPDLLEAELFGVELVNQPTDVPRKIGVLEQAHTGTLFLEEVTGLPLPTQGKLIRVLQENAFTRVGGMQKIEIDVRFIASSSANIKESISNGLPCRKFAEDALVILQTYPWPGNVRQLKNVIEWVLIMAEGDPRDPIHANALPPEICSGMPFAFGGGKSADIVVLPLREAREIFEREYLLAQVNRFGGNISQTANFVGMERSALHRKLRALGVHEPKKNESLAS